MPRRPRQQVDTTPASGGELTEGSAREPTYQRVLDESIAETFPASDPISPSAAMKTGDEIESVRDQRDWALQRPDGDAGADDHGEAPPAPAPVDRGPYPFPTQANHPKTAEERSREQRVREAAHRRFVERGRQDGSDVQDWLEAEREVDREEAARR